MTIKKSSVILLGLVLFSFMAVTASISLMPQTGSINVYKNDSKSSNNSLLTMKNSLQDCTISNPCDGPW